MKQYIIGFVLSIFLTMLAYSIVVEHMLTGWNLILVIVGLALIQLCVQLVFFLHLNSEESPHWNLVALVSTATVVFILVAGSLWIMGNLKYRHATSPDTNWILENESIKR